MLGEEGGMFSGAASIASEAYLYQLTENGHPATLAVSGIKFLKDGELNQED